ncbi:MAG: phage tail tape measure protein [Clostridium sp.]
MAADGTIIIDTRVDTSGADNDLNRLSGLASKGLSGLNKAFLGVTTAVGGVGLASIKVGMDFESSMSQVAATMGMTSDEIANGSKEFELLSEAAKEAGRTTQFSASESAEALNYLALAGYDAEKSVDMLPKILNLAAAGGMELASASDMVTDSMSALGLSVNESDMFIDKIAKTSQKSNTSVEQLGEAILTVGGTAKVLAGGTTELNTTLGILADNGVKSAEGGTALRNMILALTPTTNKAIDAFKKLNVETYDANGNLRPVNETFAEMNDKLKELSQEDRTRVLSDIFNKVDLKSVNGLLASTVINTNDLRNELAGMGVDVEGCSDMMNYLASTFEKGEGKAEFMSYAMEEMSINTEQASFMYDYLNKNIGTSNTRFNELSGYIEDSAGAAANMAETLNDNLRGDLKELGAAVEGIGVAFSENFDVSARKSVQAVAETLNELTKKLSSGELDNAISTIATTIAGIGSALLVLNIGSKIAGLIALISQAGGVFALLGAGITAIGGPITLIVAGIAGVVAAIATLWNTNEGFRDAVTSAWEYIKQVASDVWGNICTLFTETIPNSFQSMCDFFAGIPEWFSNLWTSVTDTFTQWGENISSFFTTTIPQWIEDIKKWFSDFCTNTVEMFSEWGNNITSFFTNTIPQWVENIRVWFSELPGKIGEGLGMALGSIATWCVETWNYFSTNIPLWIEGISTWFSELPEKIWAWLNESINKVIDWGSELYNKASEAVTKTIGSVSTWFSELSTKIWTGLSSSIQKIIDWGSQTWNKASEWTNKTVTSIVQYMSELPGKMWAWLVQAVQKIVQMGTDMVAKAKEAATNTINSIVTGFKELPGKMLSIGKSVVEGLWNGITSMGSWLLNKVKGFADGVIDGFRKTFKINSPSKVMIEIGKFIDEGLAKGIADNSDSVKTATKKVTDMVEKEIENIQSKRDLDVLGLEKTLKNLADEEKKALASVKGKNASATKDRIKAEYDAKQEAVKEQIKLRKKQADDEIKELKKISESAKEQLQDELNAKKEFAKEVNNLEKAITDALKEKYKQEYDAQVESINGQLSNLDRWKNESIDKINSVYDAKIDAIDAELKALDQAEKEKDRLEAENKDLDKIKRLEEAIAFEHDETNKAQLEKELEKVKQEREKRLEEEALEDKKEALKAQKEELEEKRKNEIDNINSIYESEKEFYQNRLDEAKKFYNDRTSEAKLQAEAEKLIVDKNQKEIVELIKSYAPQWYDAGQSLGDRLVEGMKPSIDSINKMIDSIWSSINAAQSAAKSAVGSINKIISNNTVNNNSKTSNFNTYVEPSVKNGYSDIEVAMRRMAFSID